MSTTNKVFLLEDDPILGYGIVTYLESENFSVLWCKNLQEASMSVMKNQIDLYLLDVMLPDGESLGLCSEIRGKKIDVPILFLTAKVDEESVVKGLNAGANDYIRKPFGNRELLARVRANLRTGVEKSRIIAGDLILDASTRKVSYQGKQIQFKRRQFDILMYFLKSPSRLLTRDNLINHLDISGEIFNRTIDSHISQLRTALKENGVTNIKITSVYGIGYRLETY
jgi:DNA-binding response OmpR family regulator